jgi:hypothetical protein
MKGEIASRMLTPRRRTILGMYGDVRYQTAFIDLADRRLMQRDPPGARAHRLNSLDHLPGHFGRCQGNRGSISPCARVEGAP